MGKSYEPFKNSESTNHVTTNGQSVLVSNPILNSRPDICYCQLLNNIYTFSSYLTENILSLPYKDRQVNEV
jgi:hypothetical protein